MEKQANNAGVSVIIVGLRKINNTSSKFLIEKDYRTEVENINYYLLPSKDILVNGRSKPISKLPEMCRGNSAFDGGNLLLLASEKEMLLKNNSQLKNLLNQLLGQ